MSRQVFNYVAAAAYQDGADYFYRVNRSLAVLRNVNTPNPEFGIHSLTDKITTLSRVLIYPAILRSTMTQNLRRHGHDGWSRCMLHLSFRAFISLTPPFLQTTPILLPFILHIPPFLPFFPSSSSAIFLRRKNLKLCMLILSEFEPTSLCGCFQGCKIYSLEMGLGYVFGLYFGKKSENKGC